MRLERPVPAPSKGSPRTWVLRLALAALILAGVGALLQSGVLRHLTLEDLRLRRSALKMFVRLHPVESVGLFMAAYGVVVALSLPGSFFMTLAGGVLFGVLEGGGAAMVGVTSGAVVMFWAAQTTIGEAIRRRAAPDGLFGRIEAGVRRHAFAYILFFRLLPVMPLWLVNIAAGLVKPPFWIYLTATIIGIAPSTFIYASIGADLDQMLAVGEAPDLRSVLHLRVFLPLLCLALLALTPIVYGRWRQRR